MGPYTKNLFASLAAIAAATLATAPAVAQQQQKPNIVVIWGDDIGQSNVSAYSRGMNVIRGAARLIRAFPRAASIARASISLAVMRA